MREERYHIALDKYDKNIVINALNTLRTGFFIMGDTASYGDPRAILGVSFADGSRRNFSGYYNEKQEEILAKTATMTDPEERNKLYQEAEQAVLNDYGFIPMYTDKSYLLVKPEVKGMKYSGLGMDIMDKVSIEK